MKPSLVAMAKQAVAAWIDDYAPSMGAALAYYALFSLAPLLLISVSIAGLVFGPEAARGDWSSPCPPAMLVRSDPVRAMGCDVPCRPALAAPNRRVRRFSQRGRLVRRRSC